MEINFENIVKKSLLEQDLFDYKIISNTHVIDSNVRTIVAKKDNITITFTFDNNSGKILSQDKSQSNEVHIVEPIIRVSDTVKTEGTMYFELYDKYFVGGELNSHAPIKLIVDPDKPEFISAFEIQVPDFEEDTVNEALEMANRFVSYLSLRQNQPVKHKRPRTRMVHPDGKTTNTISFTVDTVVVEKFDLDLEKILPLITHDSMLNQKLAHAREGIKAMVDNDFAKAISEFWIIIEDENLGLPKNYDNLRHAVNHKKIDGPDAIDDLKDNFGIQMEIGDSLNINNPKIQDILEKESKELFKLVCTYLNNELMSNSFA